MEPKVFVEAEKSLKKKRIENAINFKIPVPIPRTKHLEFFSEPKFRAQSVFPRVFTFQNVFVLFSPQGNFLRSTSTATATASDFFPDEIAIDGKDQKSPNVR